MFRHVGLGNKLEARKDGIQVVFCSAWSKSVNDQMLLVIIQLTSGEAELGKSESEEGQHSGSCRCIQTVF